MANIEVYATPGKIIHLGRAGENLATTIKFDVSDWNLQFSGSTLEGTFSLFVQQNGAGIYTQTITQPTDSNKIVSWDVTSSNTATIGLGKCELVYASNLGVIIKSIIYDLVVTNSLDVEAAGDIPAPIESWLNEVSEKTALIESASYSAKQTQLWAIGKAEIDNSLVEGYYYDGKFYEDSSYTEEIEGTTSSLYLNKTDNTAYLYRYDTTEEDYVYVRFYGAEAYALTAEEAAAEATAAALRSEGYAVGTQTGEDPETYAENNALYFAGQAADSAAEIEDLTVNVITGNPGTSATVTKTTIDDHYNLEFTIPRGDQGYGMKPLGHVNSTSDLPTLTSDPKDIGKSYSVGTSTPYNMYVWNGSSWNDYGSLGGAAVTQRTYTSGTTHSDTQLTALNIDLFPNFSTWVTNANNHNPFWISPDTLTAQFISQPNSPFDGQYLIYDGTTHTWVATTLTLNYIPLPGGAQNGNYLKYNGSAWVGAAPEWIPAPSSPTNGTILAYDSNDGWIGVESIAGSGLNIDNTPTNGSNNLVSSGGVYSAIATLNNNKQDKIVAKTITIGSSTGWDNTGHTDYYEKDITSLINDYNLTVNTKIDIQLNASQYLALMNDSISGIYIEVKDVSGTIKAFIYTISAKPSADISSLQITIMEAI